MAEITVKSKKCHNTRSSSEVFKMTAEFPQIRAKTHHVISQRTQKKLLYGLILWGLILLPLLELKHHLHPHLFSFYMRTAHDVACKHVIEYTVNIAGWQILITWRNRTGVSWAIQYTQPISLKVARKKHPRWHEEQTLRGTRLLITWKWGDLVSEQCSFSFIFFLFFFLQTMYRLQKIRNKAKTLGIWTFSSDMLIIL